MMTAVRQGASYKLDRCDSEDGTKYKYSTRETPPYHHHRRAMATQYPERSGVGMKRSPVPVVDVNRNERPVA